jgi:putative ABC transport system permease protein
MGLLSTFRLALASLLVHKGRSALTTLGIVIGISAVVALVSAGNGARGKLDQRLENAGKNLIIVRPGGRTGNGIITDFKPLSADDAEAIQKEVGPLLLGAIPWQAAPRLVSSRLGHSPTVLIGTSPNFPQGANWTVVRGRAFTDKDCQSTAPVCLLGQTAVHNLFPTLAEPVGEKVQVGRLQLVVIGLLGPKGTTPLGVDQDDQIFMPLPTLQRKVVSREGVDMILANVRSSDSIKEAEQAIVRVLRQRHHLRPDAGNDFDVSSVGELSGFAVTLTTTLQILVAVIASISLIVGGIGIMNIMLVSVTERTREIGIRMAVGASPAAILVQFLMEAIVLALLGGTAGVLVGVTGAVGLARLADWPAVISPAIVLLAFAVTAAVGLFFGFYPAWKASRLDPIDALRYE